jgi:ankyrin repeat protein
MRKVDHRGRRKSRGSTFSLDSGYADSGYSSYAQLSRTTSSSTPSWQASTSTLAPSVQSLAPSVRSRPSDDVQRRDSVPFLSPHTYNKYEKWKPLPPVPQQAADETETLVHGHAVPIRIFPQANLGELPEVPIHPPGSECAWAKRVERVARVGVVGKCSECNASKMHSTAAGGGSLAPETFRRLVKEYKAYINSRDMFGNTPLHAAAATGLGANEFQVLYEAGADLVARNDKGETFLHLIAKDKHDSSIRILEWANDQKIPFKLSTFDGKTILHSICEKNISWSMLPKILPFLRTLGPDINLRDRWGRTAMDYLKDSIALQSTYQDMPTVVPEELDRLLENFVPRYRDRDNPEQAPDNVEDTLSTPVNNLALSDSAMYDVVLRSEQDPSAQDCDGKNALHCLAHILRFPTFDVRAQPPTFRYHLVELCCHSSKVNVNAYDRCGSTPLHSFLAYPRANDDEKVLADIVKTLLENGADPNMRDRAGNTALHLACFHGHFLCMQVLRAFLQKDATMYKNAVRARNDRQQSPVKATLVLMNTDAWSLNEKQIRQKCLEVITHSEFTEDNSDQSKFWGIPNSVTVPVPQLTVSPALVSRPPSPMDES